MWRSVALAARSLGARRAAALERSLAQADANQTVPADEVFQALRAKRVTRAAR
jgi:hypothetical protein